MRPYGLGAGQLAPAATTTTGNACRHRLPSRRLPPARKARTANRCGPRLGRHSHLSRYDKPVAGLALESTEKRGTKPTGHITDMALCAGPSPLTL